MCKCKECEFVNGITIIHEEIVRTEAEIEKLQNYVNLLVDIRDVASKVYLSKN